jgi:hypothetical protein
MSCICNWITTRKEASVRQKNNVRFFFFVLINDDEGEYKEKSFKDSSMLLIGSWVNRNSCLFFTHQGKKKTGVNNEILQVLKVRLTLSKIAKNNSCYLNGMKIQYECFFKCSTKKKE